MGRGKSALGGCRGDALEGPLPLVADRAEDEAMIELKAPCGGASAGGSGGGSRDEEPSADGDGDKDDDGSRTGADSTEEW